MAGDIEHGVIGQGRGADAGQGIAEMIDVDHGGKISRHSPFCRHCGHPQPVPLLIWLLVLFLLMMVAFYLGFTVYAAAHSERFQAASTLADGVRLALLD